MIELAVVFQIQKRNDRSQQLKFFISLHRTRKILPEEFPFVSKRKRRRQRQRESSEQTFSRDTDNRSSIVCRDPKESSRQESRRRTSSLTTAERQKTLPSEDVAAIERTPLRALLSSTQFPTSSRHFCNEMKDYKHPPPLAPT